jgi:threonine-phosphate decarboxylase
MTWDYSHGGDILSAKDSFGLFEDDFLDFSSNINAVGYPKILEEIIIKSMNSIIKYPDNRCRKLVSSISHYISIDETNIIPGNGAMELLRIVVEMKEIKKILILGPTFIEYEKLAVLNDKKYCYHQLLEENEFAFCPDVLESQLTGIDAVFICNPNNPTSKLYDKFLMIRLLEICKRFGIITVVDETFIELTVLGNENSLVKEVKNYDNLIVIRAVTKYFAMPGIRLGYAVVSDNFRKYFWDKKPTWSVNTFAANIGDVFLCEKDFRENTLIWMKSEMKFLYEELLGLKKFKVFEPSSTFILLKILQKNLTSDILFDILGQKGILIRNCKNFKFLDESFIRVAVKDRNSNNLLLNALKEILL